ncbi:hypothetical protein [Kitasatospora viridis]|uniref:Uncharacterized protein n=1 Tax=Kitasatospora viridis TaxID=281105 RepID=A0A561ULA6_9ACTN|nr:hypothetical protein [Kitasatospora viridis]TWG00142.1 hypothetical protein FHX73_114011 [Kitasatospora viridis]
MTIPLPDPPHTRRSILHLRTYRITTAGERIELSAGTLDLAVPCAIELTSEWPECKCPRCPLPDRR